MSYYIYGKNSVLERLSNNNDIEELYIQEGTRDSHILNAIKNYKYIKQNSSSVLSLLILNPCFSYI